MFRINHELVQHIIRTGSDCLEQPHDYFENEMLADIRFEHCRLYLLLSIKGVILLKVKKSLLDIVINLSKEEDRIC